MATAIKLQTCKCGTEQALLTTVKGAFVYCPAQRWWNLWKHYPKRQVAWYPKVVGVKMKVTRTTKLEETKTIRLKGKQRRDKQGRFMR